MPDLFDEFNGIDITSAFKLHSESPLDPRLKVNLISDLDRLIDEFGAYEGILVHVMEDDHTYKLIDKENKIWTKIVTTDDLGAIAETINNKLSLQVVAALPSKFQSYDFENGLSKFITSYRTNCIIESDGNGKYQVIEESGNSNTYRTAIFDCSPIMNSATKIDVEFDVELSGKWHLALADLSKRPGSSMDSTYDKTGLAFYICTREGTYVRVNSITGGSVLNIEGWKHVKVSLDFTTKQVKYTVTDNTSNEVLSNTTEDFPDSTINGITGFEAYTWGTGPLNIDNISINAVYSAKENVIYVVPNDDGKTSNSYVYINNRPIKLCGCDSTGGGTETPETTAGAYYDAAEEMIVITNDPEAGYSGSYSNETVVITDNNNDSPMAEYDSETETITL